MSEGKEKRVKWGLMLLILLYHYALIGYEEEFLIFNHPQQDPS